MKPNEMEPAPQGAQNVESLINSVLAATQNTENKDAYRKSFIFLADNQFFDVALEESQGLLLVSLEGAQTIKDRLTVFLSHWKEEKEEKLRYLKESLKAHFPKTVERLAALQEKSKKGDIYQLYDFMGAFLKKEVHLMDNHELKGFTEKLDAAASKEAVERFAFFISWMKSAYPVKYTIEFRVEKRSQRSATQAYGLKTIIRLYYFIFTEENNYPNETSETGEEEGIVERGQGMLQKACDDPAFLDTILYISLHLLCALRDSDVLRLPLPKIESANDILERIRNNQLSDTEAATALHTLMIRYGYLSPLPKKTGDTNYVPSVYIFIPQSLEAHFGRLFLIASAHHENYKKDFLSKRVTNYWKLKDLLGLELAELFRERDMCPTAFSKSFMQALDIVASKLGEGGVLQRALLGYTLASRARSHKGGYGSFAKTTSTYLEDNALTGLSPSLIAREFFERGILSCIPSMLLSIISQGTFDSLAFTQQTELIQKLGMNAMETEEVMKAFMQARARARDTVSALMAMAGDERREKIRDMLHELAAGTSPGKDQDVSCFMVALNRPCPYPLHRHCLGCKYRIDTRTTLFQLGGEYKRVSALMREAVTPGEKLKYKLILKQYILPSLADALSVASKEFDEEVCRSIEMTINEAAGIGEAAGNSTNG